MRRIVRPLLALAVIWLGYACAPEGEGETFPQSIESLQPLGQPQGERLRVVTSTSLIAEVVSAVGGDWIEVDTLLPHGVDPHLYQPSPQDLQALAEADLVVINGLGLETAIARLLAGQGEGVRVISISEGIAPLAYEQSGREQLASDEQDEHEHGAFDAHVWLDPGNVILWADNCAKALGALLPSQAAEFQQRAALYQATIRELDGWIESQVARVLPADRKLVTDHQSLIYFAQRYGFRVVGAIIPAVSTAAEPSALDLAALQRTIQAEGIKAIFIGAEVNPVIAERVARDTGVRLVTLYLESLSPPDGPVPSYRRYMEYNVTAIVSALLP